MSDDGRLDTYLGRLSLRRVFSIQAPLFIHFWLTRHRCLLIVFHFALAMAISPHSKQLLFAALLLLAAAQQVSMETFKSDRFGSKLLELQARPMNRWLLETPSPAPSPALDCGAACEERCKLNSRHNLCVRACGTCCMKCKCVPPGQSGNREVCGTCYTDMKTHRNQTKCP